MTTRTKSLRQRFTENAEQFDALMVEMLEENERLKKDAERYQWIRKNFDNNCRGPFFKQLKITGSYVLKQGHDLDSAIDIDILDNQDA